MLNMTMIARVLSNPVVAMVEGIDDQTKMALSDAMSFVVEGHEHMGAGNWDGRSTLYDWASGKFPAGYVATALSVLQQRGYQAQQVKQPLPNPLGPLPTPEAPLVDAHLVDPNRAYQFRAIRILEKHGSYIARVATGGGKSRIAALTIKRIGRKTMFVTTRQVLLYQMGEALTAMGFKVSYVGDGSWDTSGDVVCAMVQTLGDRVSAFAPDPITMTQAQILAAATRHEQRQREAMDFLNSVEFVIGEEAHEAGGPAYFEVLKACRKAHYRLALTATPMMRDGESDARLIAMFGPIRLEVTEEYLISCGILATPFFKFIKPPHPPTLKRGTAWQKAEEVGIVLNHDRNKHICAEVIRASRWGMPAGVLVKRQKHGKILHDMLKQCGLRGVFIFGESGRDKREAALQKLATGEFDYVVGSTIIDVGVDVPALQLLVIAGGGKAEVAHRQRIGRALRKKLPNFAFIVDFDDGTNKHLIKHAKQRRAIVEQTPGFAEGVLKPRQDFDFVGLGFQRPVRIAA